PHIAGQDRAPERLRVRADEEVGKDSGANATEGTVTAIDLAREKKRTRGYTLEHNMQLSQVLHQFSFGVHLRRHLGIDDVVDDDRSKRGALGHLLDRPLQPEGVGGCDVEKNVRIDEGHFLRRRGATDSPRLNSMNSSVVMPSRTGRRLANAFNLAS